MIIMLNICGPSILQAFWQGQFASLIYFKIFPGNAPGSTEVTKDLNKKNSPIIPSVWSVPAPPS